MTERTNGMGEIVAILALCAVVMLGVIVVISHITGPNVASASVATKAPDNDDFTD